MAAFAILAVVYGLTWLIAVLCSFMPRRRWKPTGRIMVTGTFHNSGWFLSHVTPLAQSGVKEVILIVDEPQEAMDRVRFVCPPKWLALVLGRATVKLMWMVVAGIRYRPDLYMGYHIFPGACSALIAARIMGRPACYQMTGGSIEIVGGGVDAENRLLSSLKQPSRFIERLATSIVRQFDLVVVRGKKALEFLAQRSMRGTVSVITGSVQSVTSPSDEQRPYDLVFVGRLSATKQPSQFVETIASVRRQIPNVKGVVVGEGPLMDRLRHQTADMGISDNIEFLGQRQDVESVLSRAKVFLLTSRSEGLSIALMEAMAAGSVPVVADVGELGDLVADGVNGYLVTPDRNEEYVQRATALLCDRELWTRFSDRARISAEANCRTEVVASKWSRELTTVIAHHSSP